MAFGIKNPDPIRGVVAGMARFQFFAEKLWAGLVEVRAYSGNLVGQNGIVLRECVLDNDPIKHAESAGKQHRRGQRKKQDELRRDRARFSAL